MVQNPVRDIFKTLFLVIYVCIICKLNNPSFGGMAYMMNQYKGILTLSQQGQQSSIAQFWDSMTGQLVWERSLDGKVAASISTENDDDDNIVIIDNGKLMRVNSIRGQSVWNVDRSNR